MKELSIFIDESGDFGTYNYKSPYYIISMVMHDQRDDISAQIKNLHNALSETKLKRDFVHMGPLIRRESEYRDLDIYERNQILRRLIKFIKSVNFSYKAFIVEKKHIDDEEVLITRFVKQMSEFLKANYPYFMSFDTLKIYYDNGQSGVMRIILTVFTTLFKNTEIKKALQKDYRMLQVADLVCTTTLIELKMKNKTLSASERKVLGNNKEILKYLIKPLAKKKFRSD